MAIAISERAGNPAAAIKAEYETLMGLGCPDELRKRALAIVARGGISDANRVRFERTVRKETRLDRLQGFLTNFMLKADGLGVI